MGHTSWRQPFESDLAEERLASAPISSPVAMLSLCGPWTSLVALLRLRPRNLDGLNRPVERSRASVAILVCRLRGRRQ